MDKKRILLFLNDDCQWCKEAKTILDKVDSRYTMLDVRTNELAKAIAKKECGQEVCMLIKGEILTKFDKKKLVDAILD